jgi:hypothetical protein
MAYCVNLPGPYCSSCDHWEKADHQSEQTRLYVTTIAFETLALQVATLRTIKAIPPHVPIQTDVRPGAWEEALVRIWPHITNPIV